MTEQEILHKAECIKEIDRIKEFYIPQFAQALFFCKKTCQKGTIRFAYGVDQSKMKENANRIFRAYLATALVEYIDWLQREISNE